MRDLHTIHTQELSDVISAARICFFCDPRTSTQTQMFKASFGALFCELGAHFVHRYAAYDENKSKVPEVLANIALELEARAA